MADLDRRISRLEAEFGVLREDLRLLRDLMHADAPAALNKARYVLEKSLHALAAENGIVLPKAPTIETMIGPLVHCGAMPSTVQIHVRTVQMNASPGSHYQKDALDFSHVRNATSALLDFLEWFHGRSSAGSPVPPPKAPLPRRTVHPLQPARHFAGRSRWLDELATWWKNADAPPRVHCLLGVGGSGKTALLERVLALEPDGRDGAGVLVWSFYEDARSDAFIREALDYFGATQPGGDDIRATVEQLERRLAATGAAHLLVLDGIEVVQDAGGDGRPRGRINDGALRLLLRSIAAGVGRTRALVTSRFPLVDLDEWKGAGYRDARLDDLDRDAARALLRSWGVNGTDAELDALAARVGDHALSLAVLGSYVAELCDGDPAGAADLHLEEAADEDPRATRLARVLAGYAAQLPATERDVLTRLCVFPRGADVALLAMLARAPGGAAGALATMDERAIRAALKRLENRGLAFSYDQEGTVRVSAHPFLRQHFKRLLDVPPERIHDVVREGIALTLRGVPRALPKPADLDRYEELLEHTRLAGRWDEALGIYRQTLGGNMHLGAELGEYARGARIVAGLIESVPGAAESTGERVSRALRPGGRDADLAWLLNHAGLYAQALGNVPEARSSFERSMRVSERVQRGGVGLIARENLADLERLGGALPRARALLDELSDVDRARTSLANALSGLLNHLMGNDDEARTQLLDPGNDPLARYMQAIYLRDVGDAVMATQVLEQCLAAAMKLDRVRCAAALGGIVAATDRARGQTLLMDALAWSDRAGHVEARVHCHDLAARVALAEGNVDAACSEARRGAELAEGAGFELLAIDARTVLARAELAAGNRAEAAKIAQAVARRARTPECGYARAAQAASAILADASMGADA